MPTQETYYLGHDYVYSLKSIDSLNLLQLKMTNIEITWTGKHIILCGKYDIHPCVSEMSLRPSRIAWAKD